MDYEKAYKEALEKAKGTINYYKEHNRGDEAAIEDLEEIFPELRESEDERVRKWLIKYFNKADFNGMLEYVNGIKSEDILAWLEKQGEQKSPWSEDDERIVTALMEGFRYHQLFNPRFGEVPNAEIISWIKSLKERLS